MSWKLIDRPKTLKVTRLLAQKFASMESAPHDRPLSERRLMVYRRLLAQGQFRPVTWATASCKETDETYRVNGKHTSVMLSSLEEIPDFYVTIEEYQADRLEDVAKLYATFDSKVMSRTANEIYLNFAGTAVELKDLPRKTITLAAPGLGYWKIGAGRRGQPAEKGELLLEHSDFVLWLNQILTTGLDSGVVNGKRASHLRKVAVAAAMAATYARDKGSSTEFWEAVRDETGSQPSLPDRKLS